MKKLFFSLTCLLIAGSMFALDPVTLDGKFNIKKAKGTVAVFDIDWSKTQCGSIDDGVFVNGGMPIKQWLELQDQRKIDEGKPEDANFVKDWEAIKEEGNKYFKEEWNDEFGKKGMKITRNESEAQYRLRIEVDGLDYGNIAGSMFGWGKAGGAIMFGNAYLTDINTGEQVLKIKINHVQGAGHFSDRFRILLLLHQLVDEIEDAY